MMGAGPLVVAALVVARLIWIDTKLLRIAVAVTAAVAVSHLA